VLFTFPQSKTGTTRRSRRDWGWFLRKFADFADTHVSRRAAVSQEMNNRVDDWGKEPGQKCWSDLNAGERREYARNPLCKNRRVCRLSELELMRRVVGVIENMEQLGPARWSD